MVGHGPLKPSILVRIQVPEPNLGSQFALENWLPILARQPIITSLED